jgi:hypothetical protein
MWTVAVVVRGSSRTKANTFVQSCVDAIFGTHSVPGREAVGSPVGIPGSHRPRQPSDMLQSACPYFKIAAQSLWICGSDRAVLAGLARLPTPAAANWTVRASGDAAALALACQFGAGVSPRLGRVTGLEGA